MSEEAPHTPVLLREVLSFLLPALRSGGVLVDCTLGMGGHAEAFLSELPNLSLVGIDRDEEALAAAAIKLRRFSDRVRLVQANFTEVARLIEEEGIEAVKGIFYDLGVSSPQLDRPERGFQFRGPSPLDMRMDRKDVLTAAEIVNRYPEDQLARIIASYGEERFARRVARAIVNRRRRRPFTQTDDLAEVVKEAIPAATRRRGPHPARRTFQALRIAVNRELESLEASLPEAVRVLSPEGRIAVIAYHSLEDRIVKRTFVGFARGCRCPPEAAICVCGRRAEVRLLTKKPVRPSAEEVTDNPRARSARLRVAQRLRDPDSSEEKTS
jgi:16S rRNA (cytosine1402-N4)-methyltransferase